MKSRVSFTVLVIAGIIGTWILFKRSESVTDVINQEKGTPKIRLLGVYKEAARIIKKKWESGSYFDESLNKCEEFYWNEKKTGKEYFKCNPNLFNCYFTKKENNKINVSIDEKNYTVSLQDHFDPINQFSRKNRYYKRITEENAILVKLKILEVPGSEQFILLDDYCHETFLPRMKFHHSQKGFNDETASGYTGEVDKSFEWINSGNIFIDQFLVSKRDVFEWKVLTDRGVREKDVFSWSEPETDLSLDEMKNFCMYFNKNLLTTKYYDAAVFYKKENEESLVSLFPWGDRKNGYLLDPKASFSNPTYLEDGLNTDLCSRSFTKECAKDLGGILNFNTDSVSWMGIYQVIGGPLEALDNQEWPFFNLKASSIYFDRYSPWHILSHRLHWDGRGNSIENLKFLSSLLGVEGERIQEKEKLKIGFRCYRSFK